MRAQGGDIGQAIFDRSVKILFREAPAAICRLAGIPLKDRPIERADTAVNIPEYRADQVFILQGARLRWGVHAEYQVDPDSRVIGGWILKNAAFNAQLGIPVVLLVVYLRKGPRRRFPSSYVVEGEGIRNQHTFATVRLWEHAERIRGGDLQELAPLLVLCKDRPTEQTLREERRIIERLDVPSRLRAELFGLAMMVGSRYFTEDVLRSVFREELPMLKELSIISDWLAESEAKGEAAAARRLLLRLLRARFGSLPEELTARVEVADRDWCEEMVDRAEASQTLQHFLQRLQDYPAA